jgi:hypothetical protein
MARDYQQAKIYCIKVNTEEEYLPYVGSSCKRLLSQRMNQHRDDYKKWKKNPEKYDFLSSFTLFEKFGIENCFIELIELFPCSCNDELRKKEREHIEKQECCNKVKRVIITKKEEIERLKEYHKNHYKLHKDDLNEKHKEKYDCPCGTTLRIADKSTHEKSKKHYNFVNGIEKKILTHQDIKDRQKRYDDKRRSKKSLTTIGTLCTAAVTESV